MKKIMMRARKGATFIEYALLAGLVAIVVAAAAMLFGDRLKSLFKETSDTTKTVTSGVKAIKLDGGLQNASKLKVDQEQ